MASLLKVSGAAEECLIGNYRGAVWEACKRGRAKTKVIEKTTTTTAEYFKPSGPFNFLLAQCTPVKQHVPYSH
ncbi:hypothetical protein E2C01_084168 [Portunus trituberculatus]|uniref:Uncharacterized protein n=1 Tax=Portunus trituberculatus TaxID=210409 RepID=A0A5B7IUK7_PORTR|nr:hypothetical protein [Portunus trituberculatus]